ncbi:ParB/RepB/Spo0J family partition protein [Sagittula sp. S175]|uniref:ParB/RepB/Spo0J family partition protein n=1 Tax=Sagittula sp. S175 TaxID=3415129 RepID=UPI003C7B675C
MARSVFGTGDGADKTAEDQPPARPAAKRKPIIKGGAASDKYIRAATQGGADRTYQEIAVEEIADSRIRDRIDINEDLDSLVDSLRENGQQIPILVRIVQGGAQPYEIVVGRRRLAATRRLGLPRIKAFVARMDDREAFVAQGIENSARLETSYIERARAATQGVREGFEQKDVAEFLNISPTLVNFMVNTYLAVGEDLVQAIGPARGVGRRNWEKLVRMLNKGDMTSARALALLDRTEPDSVARFHQLLAAVQAALSKKAEAPAPQAQDYLGGRITVERKTRSLIVKGGRDMPPELLDRIDAEVRRILSDHEG